MNFRIPYVLSLTIVIFSVFSSQQLLAQFGSGRYGMKNDMSDMWLNPQKYKFCDISISTGTIPPTTNVTYLTGNGKGKSFENKTSGGVQFKYYAGLALTQAFNLARFTESNSALHLSAGVQISIAQYSVVSDKMKLKNGMNFSIDREYINAIVPLGLDYKIGAEGAADQYLKTMFTLGAGAALIVNMDGGTEFMNVAGYPYVKAEVGYFAGIAMKLRLMYFIGEHTWYEGSFADDDVAGLPNNSAQYSVTSPGLLQLSLVFMPWSRTWD